MNAVELAVAHVVKLALGLLLVGMLRRGRYRQCWSFTLYVGTVLTVNSLVSFWPATFWTPAFWIYQQTAYDLLKLAVGLELLYRTFRAFPGAWRTARVVVVALLGLSTIVLAILTPRSSYNTVWEWHPNVVTAAVWLLTATALLVVWYQVPVGEWQRAIMLGFAPYLVVFLTVFDMLRRRGWDIRVQLNLIDAVAYLVLVLFWARAAWRPVPNQQPAPALPDAEEASPAVALGSPIQERV